MNIKQQNNVLFIKETPGILWALGLFFMLVGGAFVYGSLGGYSNFDKITPVIIFAHLMVGICAVGAGVYVLYRSPGTRIAIDRNNETVTIRRNGLFGSRISKYDFTDIAGFTTVTELDHEGDLVWSLGIEFTDGRTEKLSALESHVEDVKRNIAFQANEFAYKQMPSFDGEILPEDANLPPFL